VRILFAGTPEFAAAALAAVLQAGYRVVGVLTRPDRPAGRGLHARESAVKRLAVARGLPLLQPPTLKDAQVQRVLAGAEADIMVVAAYGLLLPTPVLVLPRHGCVNVHASLLPRWRGAAPIQRALLAGDTETGISIMQMDAGLDTGPVLLARPLPIAADDTAQTLHDRLAALGAAALVEALHGIAAGALSAVAQDEARATYAPKVERAEARMDWSERAQATERKVRAFNPAPGAWAELRGDPVKIWRARAEAAPRDAVHLPGTVVDVAADAFRVACGEGVLRIEELQRPGGKRLPAAAFLRGFALARGERLG